MSQFSVTSTKGEDKIFTFYDFDSFQFIEDY